MDSVLVDSLFHIANAAMLKCDSALVVAKALRGQSVSNSPVDLRLIVGLISLITALLVIIVNAVVQFHISKKQMETQRAIAEKQNEAQMQIAKAQFSLQASAMEKQTSVQMGMVEQQAEEARKRFSAEVLSKNRQEWINTLRNSIAEYLSYIHTWSAFAYLASKDNKVDHVEKLILLSHQIQLLINPSEEKHQRLVQEMSKIFNEFVRFYDEESSGDENKMREITNEIVKLSQAIFKEEWERVKSGK